jgi:hypothetical protein
VTVEHPPSAERVFALEILRPAERPIPAALLHDRPTVGEPQLGRRVAAGTNELAVLAVRHEPVREQVRLEPLAMPRALVVERESRRARTELGKPRRLELELELHGAAAARRNGGGAVSNLEPVREQDLLGVRQQQLLMLLLVVQAELDEARELGVVGLGLEEAEHGVVDTGTIIMNLGNGRAAKHAAVGPGMHRADRLVVGVEEPLVSIVYGPVAALPGPEDEPFEEPRGVC